jgi:hypothetical protein
MTFITPCFVRVENPEKRKELTEWLESLGYRLEYLRNDGVAVLTSENRVYVYGEVVYEIIKSDYDTIDCGENIELFKALAAMNDENDREQWFVEWFADGKHWYQCPDDFIRVQYEMAGYHKATAEEIVEYFKNKER